MIAFAACVGTPAKLAAFAAPGLQRVMEPDSVFAELTTDRSIHEAYNEALEHFAAVDDLEALVLLHEDTELLDADFCDRVRAALSDPSVAIAGTVGAAGVTSLRWWEGAVAGRAAETRGVVSGTPAPCDVDCVDGLLMVLSPWAVANLRCDTVRFSGFHAYDADLCFAARAAGRRVVVADLNVFHHTKGGYGDETAFARADAAFRAKYALAA
jgi:Glycosyltransferase like family